MPQDQRKKATITRIGVLAGGQPQAQGAEMGERTNIEWTDATWNPFRGCTKVSPGCASCYMFRDQERYGRDPSVVVRAAPATFNAPLKWQRDRLKLPVGERRPLRVFTCSWSDWFHADADPWRAEAWDIIRATPLITYQILTKRPERIAACLPADWGSGYPNVWLGVSAENQYWYDQRMTILVTVPARLRFVSAEPLLKPLDLRLDLADEPDWGVFRWHTRACYAQADSSADITGMGERPVDWVICGGESGGRPGHPPRPMQADWVRSIRDQCAAVGVPLFVKQASGPRPGLRGDLPDDLWSMKEIPDA